MPMSLSATTPAVGDREGGHAHVDAPVADLHLEPAVLGLPLLGDVEVREHLDARHQGTLGPARQPLHLVQQAVDHRQLLVLGLDVDVARALFDRAVEQPVGEPHDRAPLGLPHEVVERLHVLLLGDAIDHHVVLGADDVLDHLVDGLVDVVVALDRLGDLGRTGEHRADEHPAVESAGLRAPRR
jgi:hypothetical protein